MPDPDTQIVKTLEKFNQQHLLKWWDELSDEQQAALSQQIQSVDFETIAEVWNAAQGGTGADEDSGDTTSRADVARAPASVVRQPTNSEDEDERSAAAKVGEKLLADGKVAVITVAGGQGSRLGFEHPKGMYPIGPVTDRTLFRIFAEQIAARKQRHGGPISWLIMTSAATHQETVDFFKQQNFFGLDHATVHFFQQGVMPAVDAATGRVLMQDKSHLCLSPDGHGGLVAALKSSGLLQQMTDNGVEHFFYHQVDNPTVIMCDPVLLGLHHDRKSQLTTNVVEKASPTERMGVLVDVRGRIEIIEYSELTEQQAAKEDETGQWIFWAGNTAIHVFTREFFEQLADGKGQLELHLASKKVAHIDDDDGIPVQPQEPNANKFERFIFDALPIAKNALIIEGHRDREFNPVKNAEGSDSPATSKAALNRIAHEWMAAAGHPLPATDSVEISPLTALDATQLSEKLASGELKIEDIPTA